MSLSTRSEQIIINLNFSSVTKKKVVLCFKGGSTVWTTETLTLSVISCQNFLTCKMNQILVSDRCGDNLVFFCYPIETERKKKNYFFTQQVKDKIIVIFFLFIRSNLILLFAVCL